MMQRTEDKVGLLEVEAGKGNAEEGTPSKSKKDDNIDTGKIE